MTAADSLETVQVVVLLALSLISLACLQARWNFVLRVSLNKNRELVVTKTTIYYLTTRLPPKTTKLPPKKPQTTRFAGSLSFFSAKHGGSLAATTQRA